MVFGNVSLLAQPLSEEILAVVYNGHQFSFFGQLLSDGISTFSLLSVSNLAVQQGRVIFRSAEGVSKVNFADLVVRVTIRAI